MPVPVICPSCQSRLNAPDAAIGKRVKCPKCGTPVTVPGAAPFEEVAPATPPPPPRPRVAPPPPPPQPAAGGGSPFEFEAPPPPPARKPKPAAPPAPPPQAVDDLGFDAPPPAAADPFSFDGPAEPAGAEAPAAPGRRGKSGAAGSKPSRGAEDADSPGKKPAGKKKNNTTKILLIVGGGLFLLFTCCVGGGLGIYFVASSKVKDLVGGIAKAPPPPGWKLYEPPGGGFKAYFPGEVKTETDKDGTKNYMSMQSDQKLTCIVGVDDLTNIPADVRNKMLEAAKKGMPGGKQLSKKDVRLGGESATELTIEMPSMGGMADAPPGKKGPAPKSSEPSAQTIVRIMMSGNKLYTVGIISTSGAPKPEIVNGFFDNFSVTK